MSTKGRRSPTYENFVVRNTTHSEDQENDQLAQTFARLMFQGKVKSALRVLSEQGRGKVLPLDDTTPDGFTVREVLKSKHPLAQRTHEEALLTGVQPRPHSVIFDKLDGLTVRAAVLQSQGGAGPSGMDASN